MKKLLNIILCISIILLNFTPFYVPKVKAAGNFTFAISYSDDDVIKESNLSYEDALKLMNEYPSTEMEVAVIKNASGKIVNAKYAIAETDYENNIKISTSSEGLKFLCSDPSEAATCSTYSSSYITYYASTWGTDTAFLDYNSTYDAVKIKISGVTGWLPLSDVNLVPISKFYGIYNTYNYDYIRKSNNYPKIKATKSAINIRKGPGTDYEVVGVVSTGDTYIYYPSKSTTTSDGCIWYKIDYASSEDAYVCYKDDYFTKINRMLNDTYYYSVNNILKMQVHAGLNFYESSYTLGTAPFYYDNKGKHFYLNLSSSDGLNAENRYYSFDGNYFYKNYSDMINDYRNNTYQNAVNFNHPYYAYFLYLPAHSISGYSKEAINGFVTNGTGITAFPENPKSYVNFNTGTFSVAPPSNLSMMYGIGEAIINAQKKYGVNALTIYGAAYSESGLGKSAIAFGKNNLFGMGAADDAPFAKAITYDTVADSVDAYASSISVNSFGNINSWQYNGTHQGNKLSGTAVYYASDPYSGQSKAGTAYNLDQKFGGLDEFSSTIGVTTNKDSAVKVYKEPSLSSTVIYETKNYAKGKILVQMPFIVLEKVTVLENGNNNIYYKVLTDISLSSDRVMAPTSIYNTEYSFGYIKESDLYVQNNAPVLKTTSKTVEQHEEIDLYTLVTATDLEDNLDGKKVTISYDDSNLNLDVAGTYEVIYTATDSSNYSVRDKAIITVEPSDAPEIIFEDINVPQYKMFDKMQGVKITDDEDEDILDRLVITGDISTDEIGKYKLVYTVTDLDGNITSKERIVNVIVNEKPIINANNKVITLDDSFDYLKDVTAEDKEDGVLTDKITYEGKVDNKKIGDYEITYSVKDLDNQETIKKIIVTVEDKEYTKKDGRFYLDALLFNEKTNKIDITGYLVMKGLNNKVTDNIKYDLIFENQYNGNQFIKSLNRLTENVPFAIPGESGFDYSGSWFKDSLDLSDIPSGDYTVYVRARQNNYESKVLLKNEYFNKNIVKKFKIGTKGYNFRINYYNRQIPLELFVREDGLLSDTPAPTIDNMFNQVYKIELNNLGNLNILATSHNVNGDYSKKQNVQRWIAFENIETLEIFDTYSVGSITTGPYKVSLAVSDGKDKTKAWYNANLDLTKLPKGTYSILVRTKTGTIDDYGELYDVAFLDFNTTKNVDGKKITIRRNDEKRYRIEIIIE